MRALAAIIALALIFSAGVPNGPASAQNQFAPAILVNDQVITKRELSQRAKLLKLFRVAGNARKVAREQLIDDRLKSAQIERAGLKITDEALASEMEAFANRSNLPYDQFLGILRSSGVDKETFRDFVGVGVSWRDYVRSRYGNRAQISEAEIDRVLGRSAGGGSVEVLLNEIIIPAPPRRAARALAQAERISKLTSTKSFEAQARKVSALPSRRNGGRLPWLPIGNYPASLQSMILGLKPGQVTAPIQIPNGVALFQMRAVREVKAAKREAAAIEYAIFTLPGAGDGSARKQAKSLARRVDTCDDLYGIAKGLPQERLQRESLLAGEIPQDIGLELAKLDPGEISATLTRDGGETLLFVMLCGRSYDLGADVDRDGIRARLRSKKLEGYADALLAELKASADIRNAR